MQKRVTQQRRHWFNSVLRTCREELGEYFAVDIGGTNYRVIYVKLSPDKGKVVSMRPDTNLPLADVSVSHAQAPARWQGLVLSHTATCSAGCGKSRSSQPCLPVFTPLLVLLTTNRPWSPSDLACAWGTRQLDGRSQCEPSHRRSAWTWRTAASPTSTSRATPSACLTCWPGSLPALRAAWTGRAPRGSRHACMSDKAELQHTMIKRLLSILPC